MPVPISERNRWCVQDHFLRPLLRIRLDDHRRPHASVPCAREDVLELGLAALEVTRTVFRLEHEPFEVTKAVVDDSVDLSGETQAHFAAMARRRLGPRV